MNVGQILETHLGWACAGIGWIINKSLAQFKSNNDQSLITDTLKKYMEMNSIEMRLKISKR